MHGFERKLKLMFSGTSDGAQLFYEIYRTVSKPKVSSPIGGLVSKYFYDAYSAINSWNKLGTSLRYLLWKYPDYKVWVTGKILVICILNHLRYLGHSLGGALAQIAAGELVGVHKVPSNNVLMMNFGQPRVGNNEYVEAYEKLVS